MEITLTAVFQNVPEGYIGNVEELSGANTQGDTLEETSENLKEAIAKWKQIVNYRMKHWSASHREINEFFARKICRDLEISEP